MLWRKRELDIIDWINNGKNALLVTGARQIGKTYLVRETLKKEKVNYIEFNFIDNPMVIEALKSVEGYRTKDALRNFSLLTNQPMVKGETIIFFDEVQEYKDIVTMIKFLVEEGS